METYTEQKARHSKEFGAFEGILFAPSKWAIFYPDQVVYVGRNGRHYHIHPKQRFKTEQKAQEYLNTKIGT